MAYTFAVDEKLGCVFVKWRGTATSDDKGTYSFTADRPFLFWIEHSSTGEMLFLGQVTNPA